MSALNFSAQGVRWRVTAVSLENAGIAHEVPLPGSGLLFTSPDADPLFLPLQPDLLPSIDDLQQEPVSQLASLLQRAQPVNR